MKRLIYSELIGRLMEKIESGEDGVDFVLVFKLSRFGRNAADVLNSFQTMAGREQKAKEGKWNNRLLSVRQEKISADNVYQLLLAFDKLYNTFTEVEQRDFMRAFIERIDIYPEKPDNGCWIRNIVFNFPMPVQGQEIKSLPLESESTVETVCLLSKGDVKS